MSRKEALLRLYNKLLKQREQLRQKITDDLGLAYTPDDGIHDLGETAYHMEQTELYSQLAAHESRELRMIDAALERMREGKYGVCEHCQKSIPIARLQAMPFAPFCIDCQRKFEARRGSRRSDLDWGRAYDYEHQHADREFTLSELDWES
ncbi:MAG: conjugal transfer protein TraR [Planctomycetaceae bacterium]|nr:MAG: conjugal transfer protein TraR [Planctomycetaceae bacterium]